MNPKGPLILVALLLAACVQPTPTPTTSTDSPSDPTAPTASDGPVPTTPPASGSTPNVTSILVDGPVTRNASVNYTLTTTGPVQVNLFLDDVPFDGTLLESSKTWQIPLEYGQTALNVTLEAEGFSDRLHVLLVREGVTSLRLEYGAYHPDSPGADKTDDYEVWIDVDERPSAPAYAPQGGTHPGKFTMHDQLFLFEQRTRVHVEYAWSASLKQFSVTRIDGAGNPVSSSAPPWWCYTVNEKPADGISIQAVAPGDRVVWNLGTCT